MNSSKKQITVTVLVVLGMAFLAGGIFALSRLIEDAKFNKEFEQIDTVNIELEAIRTSDDYQEKDVEAKAEIMMNALEEQAKAGNIIENSIAYDEENSVITILVECWVSKTLINLMVFFQEQQMEMHLHLKILKIIKQTYY